MASVSFDDCEQCNKSIKKEEFIFKMYCSDNTYFCSKECLYKWVDEQTTSFDVQKQILNSLKED
jgi:hypothetical protein